MLRVTISNSTLGDLTRGTHESPLQATLKEAMSNGISHTLPNHKPFSMTSFVTSKTHKSVNMRLANMIIFNSNADSKADLDNPFNGRKFASIMNLGGTTKHRVQGASQKDSGTVTEGWQYASHPHMEYFYVNLELGFGMCFVCTVPLDDSGQPIVKEGTTPPVLADNIIAYAAFTIDKDGTIKFRQKARGRISTDLSDYLKHSRLTGQMMPDEYDENAAMRALSAFFTSTVVATAKDPTIAGRTGFARIIDVSDCTYEDPSSGEKKPCFSESDNGRDFVYTTVVAGAGGDNRLKHQSWMKQLQDLYLLPDCVPIKGWKCTNGAAIGPGLADFDYFLQMANGDKVKCTEDVESNRTLLGTYKAHMRDYNLLCHATFDVDATADDVKSLGMDGGDVDVPLKVPVDVCFFRIPAKAEVGYTAGCEVTGGCVTAFRNGMHPANSETIQQLKRSKDVSTDILTKQALTALNSDALKVNTFVHFLAYAGFDTERTGNPSQQQTLRLTKSGFDAFERRFGWSPDRFLYALEKSIQDRNQKTNARMRFYMVDVIVFVQKGNLSTDFNKSGCEEHDDREFYIRHNVYCAWIDHLIHDPSSSSIREILKSNPIYGELNNFKTGPPEANVASPTPRLAPGPKKPIALAAAAAPAALAAGSSANHRDVRSAARAAAAVVDAGSGAAVAAASVGATAPRTRQKKSRTITTAVVPKSHHINTVVRLWNSRRRRTSFALRVMQSEVRVPFDEAVAEILKEWRRNAKHSTFRYVNMPDNSAINELGATRLAALEEWYLYMEAKAKSNLPITEGDLEAALVKLAIVNISMQPKLSVCAVGEHKNQIGSPAESDEQEQQAARGAAARGGSVSVSSNALGERPAAVPNEDDVEDEDDDVEDEDDDEEVPAAAAAAAAAAALNMSIKAFLKRPMPPAGAGRSPPSKAAKKPSNSGQGSSSGDNGQGPSSGDKQNVEEMEE